MLQPLQAEHPTQSIHFLLSPSSIDAELKPDLKKEQERRV
jgi:hypothetical protein